MHESKSRSPAANRGAARYWTKTIGSGERMMRGLRRSLTTDETEDRRYTRRDGMEYK